MWIDHRLTDEQFYELQISMGRMESEYYQKELPKVITKINEFQKEFSWESRKKVRRRYLIDVLIKKELENIFIVKYEKMMGRNNKWFDWITKNSSDKIRKYLKEYKLLGGTTNYVFQDVDRLRKIPIHTLEPFNGKYKIKSGINSLPCPFHDEKKGSFMVYADNSYHCFGCGAHGRNALDYIIQYKKIDFKEAIKYLKKV